MNAQRPPSRRAMLGGTAAVMVSLTGCTPVARTETRTPDPQVVLLSGAMAAERRLVDLYAAVLAAHSGLAAELKPLHDHHVRHLAVLKHNYRPGTETRTATPTPGTTVTVPHGRDAALSELRKAEKKAAAARADEVRRAKPGLAQLLASVGACEAGHVTTLAGLR